MRHHDRRLYWVAAVYAVLVTAGFTLILIDPSPGSEGPYTTAENVGIPMFVLPILISAVHGTITAALVGNNRQDWVRRESARQFAAYDPIRAREMGIGRPTQLRNYSDGGLVDLNHAVAYELAMLPGISADMAHRIVADRQHRGAFRSVRELAHRGLVPDRLVNRLEPRTVCIVVVAQRY